MNNKSFTLIEVTVAIFLLTVGTVGAFSLIQRTIVLSTIGAAQLQATYLAQEGIEIVRNIRDSNWLAGVDWGNNLSSGVETGLLGRFDRQIVITELVPDNKIEVSVMVSWEERGRSHQVTAQTELYNWR